MLAATGIALTGVAHDAWSYGGTVVLWSIGEAMVGGIPGAIVASLAPADARGRYQGSYQWTWGIARFITLAVGTTVYAAAGPVPSGTGERRVSQGTRYALSRASVMAIWPGAWPMANGGRDFITAAWGVTPQAQKTGSSPARISTASPKSGRSRSAMPSTAGSPTCTGAPCTAG